MATRGRVKAESSFFKLLVGVMSGADSDSVTSSEVSLSTEPHLRVIDNSRFNVTVNTLQNIFTHNKIKERAHIGACTMIGVNPRLSSETAKQNLLYKGYYKLMLKFLLTEYGYIRDHIRILQRRKMRQPRQPRQPRALTKYTLFCREIKTKFPHHQITGKIQAMWEAHKQQEYSRKMIALKRPKAAEEEEKEPEVKLEHMDDEETESDDSDDSDDDEDSVVAIEVPPSVS